MNINQKSAMMIRSLLRQLRLSDHIVWPVENAPAIKSGELLEELEASPKVGDGTGDAAIAIGEHAFRAGYEACRNDVAHSKQVVSYPGEYDKHLEAAWGAYDPPEHIKDLS